MKAERNLSPWLLGLFFDSQGGGSKLLRSVGELLPEFIAYHPRRFFEVMRIQAVIYCNFPREEAG
jgi:hypothetical protein